MHQIHQVAQERAISWTTWTRTLLFFEDSLRDSDVAHWAVPLIQVMQELQTLRQPARWGLESPAIKTARTKRDARKRMP